MVLKPSEHAPACSSFLAKTLPLYLDNDAIKVIEGGADVSEQLLQHKWDKIFFTGITSFLLQFTSITKAQVPEFQVKLDIQASMLIV